MVSRPSMLSRCGLLVLVVGLVVQLGAEVQMSWATDGQAVDRQTVPTRTPTPEPAPPTEPPPPPTNTPVPAPPTHTAAPPVHTVAPPTHTPAPAPTLVATSAPALIEVNTATNVYSGPGFGFPVLGSLEQSDTAPVLGRTADSSWWQISFLEDLGWVSDKDVTASPTAYDVPIVTVSSAAEDSPEPENLPLAGAGFWLSPAGVALWVLGALLLAKGVWSHLGRAYK